jgi:hypothetical protein
MAKSPLESIRTETESTSIDPAKVIDEFRSSNSKLTPGPTSTAKPETKNNKGSPTKTII